LSHEIGQASASTGPVHVISSDHGHDGFLIEIGQVGEIIRGNDDPKRRALTTAARTSDSVVMCGSVAAPW